MCKEDQSYRRLNKIGIKRYKKQKQIGDLDTSQQDGAVHDGAVYVHGIMFLGVC